MGIIVSFCSAVIGSMSHKLAAYGVRERPFSLEDTLELCGKTADKVENIRLSPLRCMRRREDGSAYDVVDYTGEDYLAISYSWPSPGWVRLHDSNEPVYTFHGTGTHPRECEHFSAFARKAVEDPSVTPRHSEVTVWLDHECIDQENRDEKGRQVAIMDKIYNKATRTVILLEDIEISTNEFDLLQTSQLSRVDAQFDEIVRIVKRIIGARWFSRAWCSQESILSRWPTLFVHRADDPSGTPIHFSLIQLIHWMERAAIRDPSINNSRLSANRGLNPSVRVRGNLWNATAWAFGIVYSTGCYNPYDKIALVNNLVQTEIQDRLVELLYPKESGSSTIHDNVLKVVNTLSVLRGDFSLLLTIHSMENPAQGVKGFCWAAPPIRGDSVSESWNPRAYEVDRQGRDKAVLNGDGLSLQGVSAVIQEQTGFKFSRDADGLHVTVNGEHRIITSDWLSDEHQTSKLLPPGQAFFRDLCYLIEAFDAIDIYRLIFDSVNEGRWSYDEAYGNLKTHLKRHFSRYSPIVNNFLSRLAFMRAGGIHGFTMVKISEDVKLLVRGNISDLCGKTLFQPFVIRPKEFELNIPTVNSFVLHESRAAAYDAKKVYRCLGGVRGFGLIPERIGECETYAL